MPTPAVHAAMPKRLLASVVDRAVPLLLGGAFVVTGTLSMAADPRTAGPLLTGGAPPEGFSTVLVGLVLLTASAVLQRWYRARGRSGGQRLLGDVALVRSVASVPRSTETTEARTTVTGRPQVARSSALLDRQAPGHSAPTSPAPALPTPALPAPAVPAAAVPAPAFPAAPDWAAAVARRLAPAHVATVPVAVEAAARTLAPVGHAGPPSGEPGRRVVPRSGAVLTTSSFASDPVGEDVEATRLRPARGKVPEVTGPEVTVEITDGRRVTFSGTALVGRNPACRPGEDPSRLITVADPGRSVSKTHLAIGVDASGVWVRDRASTNGTVVTLPDGQQILCGPGQQVRLPAGATVAFGDYGLSVVPTEA